jgi:NADH-quinone oxidoreductase subunit K
VDGLDIPLNHILFISSLLFAIGMLGLMIRRNIIFILMSLEVMLNSAALAFVAAGAHWGQPDGQVVFILTVAAAEVAVGLGLVLQVQKRFKTLDMDHANRMQG